MRWIPAALASTLLLGLLGCKDPLCTALPSSDVEAPAALLLAGRPEELTVFAGVGTTGTCGDDGRSLVTSVEVEILAPGQQPVPNDTALLPRGPPGASIRFTPTALGSYHFFVAFDPAANIQQFDLLSVRDRSAEPPLHTLQSSCLVLERTRRGTWICSTLVFYGGGVMQQIPEGRVAIAGDVVWVVSATKMDRYVDTGDRLGLTASRPHQNGVPEFILPSEDELVVLTATTIQRVTFDGAALAATEPVRWERTGPTSAFGTQGPQGIIFRTGDRLAILHNAFGSQGFQVLSCTYQLSNGRFLRTSEPCQTMTGAVVGFEPGSSVLWLADQISPGGPVNALHRLEWGGTEFVARASLLVPPTLALPFPLRLYRSSAVPVLRPQATPSALRGRSAVPIYDPGQSLLQLEHLDGEVTEPQASASYFWGNAFMNNNSSVFTGTRIRALAPAP
jgi:hypothetical protein